MSAMPDMDEFDPEDNRPANEIAAEEREKPTKAVEWFHENVSKKAAAIAFSAEAIAHGANLEPLSPEYQEIVVYLKSNGIRTRDWESAVKKERAGRAKEKARRAEREIRSAAAEGDGDALIEYAKVQIQGRLLLTEEDKPRRNLANLATILALDPRWKEALAYDLLRESPVFVRHVDWHEHDAPDAGGDESTKVGEHDAARATAWVSREYDIDVHASLMAEAIAVQAHRREINPLADYFDSLQWDGTPRLDNWLTTYLGVQPTAYTAAVGSRWLISGVARAYQAGCKVDFVLVFESRQGKHKSTSLLELCPRPEWFFDSDLDIGDKDAAQSLRGKFIVELGELAGISRAEVNKIKAFLTRRVDSYRPSYGRVTQDFPRRCIFAASTNEEKYLRDPTGNRRYWPIRTGKIDIDAIKQDRDQIWAEAVARYRAGHVWYVDTDELAALCKEEQDERQQPDPWSEPIAVWLNERASSDVCKADDLMGPCGCKTCGCVTTGALLLGAIGIEFKQQKNIEEQRAANCLRALGWASGDGSAGREKQRRYKGAKVRPYYPPATAVECADLPEVITRATVTCMSCRGTGHLEGFAHRDGGKCYPCSGTGRTRKAS